MPNKDDDLPVPFMKEIDLILDFMRALKASRANRKIDFRSVIDHIKEKYGTVENEDEDESSEESSEEDDESEDNEETDHEEEELTEDQINDVLDNTTNRVIKDLQKGAKFDDELQKILEAQVNDYQRLVCQLLTSNTPHNMECIVNNIRWLYVQKWKDFNDKHKTSYLRALDRHI